MPTTKLTLNIDETVIKAAKVLARRNHSSLSRMVEKALVQLLKPEKLPSQIHPDVEAMSGLLAAESKEEYRVSINSYLEEKYLKDSE
ncbi:MAG: hypothetical protein KDC92_02750 [Bacteroidetes bacterium]|nr:hypothetical protein [Bacteroidota bacterium]